MPGFLVFEQFEEDIDMDDPDNQIKELTRFPKRFNPVQFIEHGLWGEYNVDLDPGELFRRVLDGQSPEPWAYVEAYYGWLSVVNLTHTIAGRSKVENNEEGKKKKKRDKNSARIRGNDANSTGNEQGTGDDDDDDAQGRNLFEVEIELDVSLPQLIKAALEPEDPEKADSGSRTFKYAQIHMCTTAQIDTSLLSPGQGNPATFLLSFLGNTLRFNIIPYLTITMKDVRIEEVQFAVAGDAGASPPTVNLDLSYKEVTYTYHVINTSNMSLYHVDYHYVVDDRSSPKGEDWFHLSNPFL